MEGMMWVIGAYCKKCGCKPDEPFNTNYADKTVMCERCAIEEYNNTLGYLVDKCKFSFWKPLIDTTTV